MLLAGKTGLVIGVANKHSIAWAIAQVIMREGGVCGLKVEVRFVEGVSRAVLVERDRLVALVATRPVALGD